MGGLGVKHSKVWGSCQTAGPTGTNIGSRLQIHLGMNIGKSKSPLNTPGGIGGGVGVTNSKVSGSCQTAAPIGTKFGTSRPIRIGMDIG